MSGVLTEESVLIVGDGLLLDVHISGANQGG